MTNNSRVRSGYRASRCEVIIPLLYLNQTQRAACTALPYDTCVRPPERRLRYFRDTGPHSKTRQRISIVEITIVLRIGAFVPTVFATYTNYRAFRARVRGKIERLKGRSALSLVLFLSSAPADRVTECRSLYLRGARGV